MSRLAPATCVIVDDEPLAVALLADYVAKTPDLTLAATFTDAIAALQHLRAEPPALLFTDIEMPGLTGMELAKILGADTAVAFTTAYPDYAVESYELRAVDYLLKPVSYARFAQTVARLASRDLQIAGHRPAPFFVKSGHRTERVDLDALQYLSGAGDYTELHRLGQRKLLTLERLSDLEARLPPERFCRIHRSHIVALGHIDYVERQRVVIGAARLPVSDSYWEGFRARLGH